MRPLNERFVAAKEHVEQGLRQLPPSPEAAQVHQAITNGAIFMLIYGRGHRRRRSRYALLRCAVDHSASRKYYQGDELTLRPVTRRLISRAANAVTEAWSHGSRRLAFFATRR